ncbi:MAG: glycosyltransferase family 4 protein [Planctomycetota bacterium]|nr:glycosyltransferase family 4 protein [Planctomycetota bacterium]MDA1212001.1 glycosyltransferase family 4 protein [Planctomycetota bacterium]
MLTNKPLTVVQVLPALDGGGVERGTLEVAAELVRRGHHSYVVSASGRLVNELTAAGSMHIPWDIGRKSLLTLKYVRPLKNLLRDLDADIVHARSRLPAWITWLAWRTMPKRHRPRFVTTVHGLYSANRYSRIMVRSEAVIAVSKTIERYIARNYPGAVSPDHIHLISRGIDPLEFPRGYRPTQAWLDEWYREYPRLVGKHVLTLPGRITRRKGHADFLRLIASLIANGSPVHGLIVGGDDPHRMAYARELRETVTQLGLEEDVTFTGQRSDIREIYAVSDAVFSLSNKPESFGRTVLEALAIGRPVIGYAHGGVGEILDRLYRHGTVPLGDEETLLATTLQRLNEAMDPAAIPPEFHLQTMLDRTLSLYADLTGRQSARSLTNEEIAA